MTVMSSTGLTGRLFHNESRAKGRSYVAQDGPDPAAEEAEELFAPGRGAGLVVAAATTGG
jgi:hypothetical protein